jgi:F-type H+-transporting ATPase subunit alpha
MAKTAIEYAALINDLSVSLGSVLNTRDVFNDVPVLKAQLSDPTMGLERKHTIIDRIFPHDIRDFLKILCDSNDIDKLNNIIEAFLNSTRKKQGICRVVLSYVTPPSEEQLDSIRSFIMNKYQCGEDSVVFVLKEDKSLVSGFKLTAGNDEYDWSALGRLNQLKQKLDGVRNIEAGNSSKGIVDLLKAVVEDFDLEAKNQEIGIVRTAGDGIVSVEGIDHAATVR